MNLRKFKNGLFYAFCIAATATGLIVLSSILYPLIGEGIKGLKWSLFTELTPAPGSEGGLKNAIYGSLILTGMGIAIAAPLGVLAGTWLSEAPKENKTAETLRFS